MAIYYPPYVSKAAKAAVEAEELRAGRDFDEATADTTPRALTANPYMCERTGRLLKEYVFRPFVQFSKEACKLDLEGISGIGEIQRECEDYLRRSAIEACHEKLPGVDTRCWDGGLLEWIKRDFGKKALFQDHEDRLLEVADAQSKPAVEQCAETRTRTGDITLLQNADGSWKVNVSFAIAEKYLGIGERRRQKLMSDGRLLTVGEDHRT
jgi:hypothetical protein